jgi:DNA repair exonuclease SbcCD ATPase subunit
VDIGELVVGMIAGGLITQAVAAWKARRDAAREDRKQAADERQQKSEHESALASGARTIVESSTLVVRLQDDQIADLKAIIEAQRVDFQKRFDAQGAALAAYETRLDREMENRRKLQAELSATTQRLEHEMDRHATTKAQVAELMQTVVNLRSIGERGEELIKINDDLKTELFNISRGVMRLIRQLREAGLEPEYQLEVPALDS